MPGPPRASAALGSSVSLVTVAWTLPVGVLSQHPRGRGGRPHGPWTKLCSGPPALPPPARGLPGGSDPGRSCGGAAGTRHMVSKCLFTQKTHSEPGIFVILQKCQPVKWSLCSPWAWGRQAGRGLLSGQQAHQPLWQRRGGQPPAGRGAPRDPEWGCHSVPSTGTASTQVYKMKGEAKEMARPGCWTVDRTLQGANQRFPKKCLGQAPLDACWHPLAHRRAACGSVCSPPKGSCY